MIERFVRCYTSDESLSLRESVVYALATLLSTRTNPNIEGEYPGLPGFGVPCWQSMNKAALCKVLEQRIACYEPRLQWVKIAIDDESDALVFQVEGSVRARSSQNFNYKISFPCHLKMT